MALFPESSAEHVPANIYCNCIHCEMNTFIWPSGAVLCGDVIFITSRILLSKFSAVN